VVKKRPAGPKQHRTRKIRKFITPGRNTKQDTKQAQMIAMLHRKSGTSIIDIASAVGWQRHSVRGFFAAVVKKRLGFDLVRFAGTDGQSLYRIELLSGRPRDPGCNAT
jgi:hypothetical protein